MMVAKMRHIWKFGIPAKKQTNKKQNPRLQLSNLKHITFREPTGKRE